ncbi:MAG: methyltransferase [Alphaproteobacteria bacterium]|jgi:tRNA1(Val) A37 N6-methylase TrmN6|nr:methyltransferase [Alphaproteobacteria bacterium]
MDKVLNSLLGEKVKIWQNSKGWKVSQDAVILSHFVELRSKDKEILDIGCGNGGATLCLASRVNNKNFTSIDIQESQLNLLKLSIEENNFENNFSVIKEDLSKQSSDFKKKLFDTVMTNPPYYLGETSPDNGRSIAHTENKEFPLEKWISASMKKLKSNGSFYIIHQAERLDTIIQSIKNEQGGAIEVFPIFSKIGDDFAKRIVIKAQKVSKTPTKLHKPLYIYKTSEVGDKSTEDYTEDAKKIFNV